MCVLNRLIFFIMSDLFIYPENMNYFNFFFLNSLLSKNSFHLFKGRLETSLLWDLIFLSMGEN